MSNSEKSASAWTYRMEVSPTGQGPASAVPQTNDPVVLLHAMISLQSQTLDTLRQILETDRQQLEMLRETTMVAREQRSRNFQELEKWQQSHEPFLENCRVTLGRLEQVHASLMNEMMNHVDDHLDEMLEGEFAVTDFVDKFGHRLAHLNTMLSVLRPLSVSLKKTETPQQPG